MPVTRNTIRNSGMRASSSRSSWSSSIRASPVERAAVGQVVGHVAANQTQRILKLVDLFGRQAGAVNLQEPGGTGVDSRITPANLLAQRVLGHKQRNQRPVVIVVRQQLIPTIPVFFIRVDRFNDADYDHPGAGLPVAAGGGNDVEPLAQAECSKTQTPGGQPQSRWQCRR